MEKALVWLGDSRDRIRVATVGLGVQEIRIHTGVEHRVLYVARFPEAVYVLHACEKRTRRTLREDLGLAKQRLRLLINRRGAQEGVDFP
jgi:phage-related protein